MVICLCFHLDCILKFLFVLPVVFQLCLYNCFYVVVLVFCGWHNKILWTGQILVFVGRSGTNLPQILGEWLYTRSCHLWVENFTSSISVWISYFFFLPDHAGGTFSTRAHILVLFLILGSSIFCEVWIPSDVWKCL